MAANIPFIFDNRKRSREDDHFDNETMPLSKRINNLHLSNSDDIDSLSTSSTMSSQGLHMNGYNEQEYDPELSESENPFYYNKNKLLYELHLERQKRNVIIKRSREDDHFDNEIMPLLKRFKHLHLNNSVDMDLITIFSQGIHTNGYNEQEYDLELSEAENPFYYKNKLLYESHLERQNRNVIM